MPRKIYEIIEVGSDSSSISVAYDHFMMVIIVASLIPLAFRRDDLAFSIIDRSAVAIFIVDYILRLLTADFKYGNKNASSFRDIRFRPWRSSTCSPSSHPHPSGRQLPAFVHSAADPGAAGLAGIPDSALLTQLRHHRFGVPSAEDFPSDGDDAGRRLCAHIGAHRLRRSRRSFRPSLTPCIGPP